MPATPVRLPGHVLERMRAGGVWVPSPLALSQDLELLEEWQRLLTLYYLRGGARAVIPCAHTGEFAGGDLNLYGRWLPIVADVLRAEAADDTFLMAAIGGPDAIRQAEMAAANGYDIVMVAPTAFAGMDDDGAAGRLREIAAIIPTFGFELQRAVPGSREFSAALWDAVFRVAYGAKGASFDTYRAQAMLAAAARCPRRDELVLASGNDDRIVADLGGRFPFRVGEEEVVMCYNAGLLGHFATDTRSAVQWAGAVMRARDGEGWRLDVDEKELAHLVNMCNGALFDALGGFENSVWGVKYRLTSLGLLPGPFCFHEGGRPGQAEAIDAAYAAHPVLSDGSCLRDHLADLKREVGL